MPQRIEQIKHWLSTELQADIHHFDVASNDASFRRYFRVRFNNNFFGQPVGQSFIVMDAPPEKETIDVFIDMAERLETTGIHVPHLFAINKTAGFIIMSDLGHQAYLPLLAEEPGERADKLYADAMNALVVMQVGMQEQRANIPLYDRQRLQLEMDLLPEWYIKVHCQQMLSESEQSLLSQAMDSLLDSALQQPQVFVHRDYHSRNLMYVAEHNPGVIDFQDAVIGPITYDLVSLLRDSYIAWPEHRVYQWLEQYRQMLLSEGLLEEDDAQQFIRWFDLMGIQRQLKVVGIFCRLHYRDGKSHYLDDIPQTLDYLLTVCGRYPEFDGLLQLLKRLAQQQIKIAAIE